MRNEKEGCHSKNAQIEMAFVAGSQSGTHALRSKAQPTLANLMALRF